MGPREADEGTKGAQQGATRVQAQAQGQGGWRADKTGKHQQPSQGLGFGF